jgi:hypothetical protein
MADPWLTGWKEIAKYLGIHEETAMRWAKEEGMPVFDRHGGLKAAIPELLDLWLIEFTKTTK